MNKQLFLLASAFLATIAVAGKFSAELNRNVQDKAVTLDPHTILIRKDITGASSNYALIDERTEKIDGISTINGTRLAKNQAVVVHAIAIGYKEGLVADGIAKQAFDGDAPALLRNATLLITQNGREVINEPIANFLKGEATTAPGDYFLELPSFRYLVDDETIDMRLVFPNGGGAMTAAADNANYFELRLLGQKTSRKA